VYSPRTLANSWGCSERHIRNLINAGQLRAFKIGKMLRIQQSDADEYAKRDPVATRAPCDVYVIKCGTYIKIGKAINVTRRISAMRAHIPFDIELIAVLTEGDGHQLELDLHKRFAEHRYRGEWFKFNGSMALWVAEGCPL